MIMHFAWSQPFFLIMNRRRRQMIKVIITAPKGKMDSLILEEAVKCDTIEVVGAIGP